VISHGLCSFVATATVDGAASGCPTAAAASWLLMIATWEGGAGSRVDEFWANACSVTVWLARLSAEYQGEWCVSVVARLCVVVCWR
jgi:hypothetical protein